MKNFLINNKNVRYNQLRYLLLMSFIVFKLMLMIIGTNLPSIIYTAIMMGLTAASFLIIFFDFGHEHNIWKVPHIKILIMFFLIAGLSSIINFRYGWFENIKVMLFLPAQLFIIYACSRSLDIEQGKKELILVSHAIIWILFLCSLISLCMFFMQINYTIIGETGKPAFRGFVNGRLWGIYGDPNYSSVLAIVSLLITGFLYHQSMKKWMRISYGLNIFVQFLFIVLTGSRTGTVCLIFVAFIGVYFWWKEKMEKKSAAFFKKHGLGLIAGVISVVALLGCVKIVENSAVSYSLFFYQAHNQDEGKEVDRNMFVRQDTGEEKDVSNLRFTIWGDALQIFSDNPLLGTSPRNMIPYAKEHYPESIIAKKDYLTHNSYIEVLTCTGILGFGLLVLFLALCAKDALKYFYAKVHLHYYHVLLCVLIVVCLLVSIMFLSDLFFATTLSSYIFWTYLGYGIWFIHRDGAEKALEEKEK